MLTSCEERVYTPQRVSTGQWSKFWIKIDDALLPDVCVQNSHGSWEPGQVSICCLSVPKLLPQTHHLCIGVEGLLYLRGVLLQINIHKQPMDGVLLRLLAVLTDCEERGWEQSACSLLKKMCTLWQSISITRWRHLKRTLWQSTSITRWRHLKMSSLSYDNVKCRHFVATFEMSSLSDGIRNVVTKWQEILSGINSTDSHVRSDDILNVAT